VRIEIGPTGRICRGHVLDIGKDTLEARLRGYDPLLYLAWNPKKRRGYGCWEVRRRPDKMTATPWAELENGQIIFKLDYVENNLIHHVMDADILSHDVMSRLAEMDMWKYADAVGEAEYRGQQREERLTAEAHAESMYVAKQHRRQIQEIKELILSGVNPARIIAQMK
jgi:hypothetical protein